jgi:tetrahydromethanopterin S-methyltransferase subunit A
MNKKNKDKLMKILLFVVRVGKYEKAIRLYNLIKLQTDIDMNDVGEINDRIEDCKLKISLRNGTLKNNIFLIYNEEDCQECQETNIRYSSRC